MNEQHVKNLIFDLGGVILDLDVENTLRQFSQLAGLPQQRVTEIFKSSPEFNAYEKGEMEDEQFREFIRRAYARTANDSEIDHAWNAMLRGLPTAKLELLLELKKSYRVFLLSNTNGIHLKYINEVLVPASSDKKDLDDYFHKAYYSHRMLKRKPESEIFQQVLDENSLEASQSLFLDDNLSNVEAAASLGIKTLHITRPDHILEYFNE